MSDQNTDAEKIDEILKRLRRLEPSKRWRKIERTILAALAAWIGYREVSAPSMSTAPTTEASTTSTSTTSTTSAPR
jgi:hypothetical protein